jgi:hypothetical protein
MYRRIRTAAFAVVIAVLLSGLALAQGHDDDQDYNKDKDRQHESKRDHDWDHDRDHDWDHDKDRNRDDHRWRDRDDRDVRGGQGGYGNSNPGYNQGYQDGSRVGQSDMAHGKPFNSYPRGAYRTSDHGYQSGYGNKGAYQQSYLSGYETGYRSSYRRSSGR